MKSKKMLKVFSLQSKQEILLSEDCPALFSTESSLVKMLLADILEYVSKPFPCGAMLHLNAEIYQNPATATKVTKGMNTVSSLGLGELSWLSVHCPCTDP